MSYQRKTKIVATVGPASETKESLIQLAKAGVNVFRLNFSHGTHEDHLQRLKTIREIGKPLAEALAEENVYLDHVLLTAGATITIGADAAERAVTVLSGSVDCGGTTLNQSQTAFFDPGATISITAITDARLLSFGGAPVGGRFMWWNFVASRMELIDAAKRKWRAAEFALPDGDAEAFTPCPEDGGRPLLKAAGYSL